MIASALECRSGSPALQRASLRQPPDFAMSDSRFDQEATARKPLPQCKAFLIFADVEVDDLTDKLDLYKLVNVLGFPKFPASVPSLVASFMMGLAAMD